MTLGRSRVESTWRAALTAVAALLFCGVGCSAGMKSEAARSDNANVVAGEEDTPAASNNRNAFPNETNTGPVGRLVPYGGPMTITRPGTLIENVDILAPQVRVAANDVTFRNVRFVYNGSRDQEYAMVAIDPRFSGITLENCEIDGRDGTARAVSGYSGVTVRRCNIHNTGNGVEVQDRFTVEDSYIHEIFTPPGLGWHADGVQARDGSVEDIRIVGNTILLTGDETAAVHVISHVGVSRNVIVAGNLLGGGSYTVYVGAAEAERFIVKSNAFTSEVFPLVGRWGAWYPGGGGVDAIGNFLLGSGVTSDPPW